MMTDSEERAQIVQDWEPALKRAWDWAFNHGDQEARAFFWNWIMDIKGWQA